jgi:hypothetical protein
MQSYDCRRWRGRDPTNSITLLNVAGANFSEDQIHCMVAPSDSLGPCQMQAAGGPWGPLLLAAFNMVEGCARDFHRSSEICQCSGQY